MPSMPSFVRAVVVAGHPHDVVDAGRHEAAAGGGDVEVGPGPDDAAGVDAHRLEGQVAGLVEDRRDQQDVAVLPGVEVDERDPRPALDAVLARSSTRSSRPPCGCRPTVEEGLGVGGVGAGRDALGVPLLVALVVGVPAVRLAHRPSRAAAARPAPRRTAYLRSPSTPSSPVGSPRTAASASISRTFSSVRCRCTPCTYGDSDAVGRIVRRRARVRAPPRLAGLVGLGGSADSRRGLADGTHAFDDSQPRCCLPSPQRVVPHQSGFLEVWLEQHIRWGLSGGGRDQLRPTDVHRTSHPTARPQSSEPCRCRPVGARRAVLGRMDDAPLVTSDAPRADGLVAPVRVDVDGVARPDAQAGTGPAVATDVARGCTSPQGRPRSDVEQRILEQGGRIRTHGAVTGWAALRWQRRDLLRRHGGSTSTLPVPIVVGPRAPAARPRGSPSAREQLAPSERELVDAVWTDRRRIEPCSTRSGATGSFGQAIVDIEMAVAAGEVDSPDGFRAYVATRNAWTGVGPASDAAALRWARLLESAGGPDGPVLDVGRRAAASAVQRAGLRSRRQPARHP